MGKGIRIAALMASAAAGLAMAGAAAAVVIGAVVLIASHRTPTLNPGVDEGLNLVVGGKLLAGEGVEQVEESFVLRNEAHG